MVSLNPDPIPAPPCPRARRVAEAVFVAVVLGWLGSFPIRTLMESRPEETVTLDGEKRVPTPFPDLAALPSRDWGRGIEAWYNDSMPSRRWLIRRARKWHLGQLLSPFGVYVPGRGGQRFRIGKEWPELEDYLGTFRLDGVALGRWADLFAGRRAWAEAMGCSFVSVVSPEKVQLMPDAPFPWLSRHRGECLYDQLAAHLGGLGEDANILSPRGALRAPGDGRPLFLDGTDHHPDAEGLYRMYAAIADAIPGCGVVPWYGAVPPPDVAAGQAPGCWTDGRRLRVSVPAWETYSPDDLALAPPANPESNQRSVGARRAGGGTGLHLVLAHTSYLRYTLASWDDAGLPVRFPFGDGTAQVDSLLWKFLDDDDLDRLTSAAVPAAIVQEINEWHLSLPPPGLTPAKRNAAAYSRAEPLPDGAEPPPGTEVCVRAVLTDVESGGVRTMPMEGKCPRATAILLRGGNPVESVRVNPGIRRAVFFAPVAGGEGPFSVAITDGTATVESLDVRVRPVR